MMLRRIQSGSVAVAFVAGALVCVVVAWLAGNFSEVNAAPAPNDELAALRADVARLKDVVPDQSHSMMDVAYHFSNLWFAGQNKNWPLAQFYSDELHSHLKWAVRIIPMRKDREGRDVDLRGILSALEQTSLKDLDGAIKARDAEKFAAAYKMQMQNCMACHEAAGKEFLRLHIPERPDSNMVDFNPAVH